MCLNTGMHHGMRQQMTSLLKTLQGMNHSGGKRIAPTLAITNNFNVYSRAILLSIESSYVCRHAMCLFAD